MAIQWIMLASINFLMAADTSQRPISELALFNRCYSHITQNALPLKHPLFAEVSAGKLSAVNACMKVLDSAKLNATGGSEGRLVSDTPEGRQVLLTFNDFHRSWFPNDDLNSSMPDETWPRGGFIHDEQEAGLHVTRALFTDGVAYNQIITGDSAMEALRSNGPSQKDHELGMLTSAQLTAAGKARIMMWTSSNPYESNRGRIPMNIELIQTGDLLGVQRLKLNSNKINFMAHTDGVVVINDKNHVFGQPTSVHQSFGAGIIGTRSYLLLNLGRPNLLPSNGGLRMSRRWAKAILSDVLCRDLPVVRQTDAAPFVNRNPTSETPAFRNATTCMSCHSTMDPMASVIRNISFMGTMYGNYGGAMELVNWPVTMSAETGPVDDDLQFYQRPSNGQLFFRSYDGNLIDKRLTSVYELGQALSQTNDLYVCAAARYFQYFTGITPNLKDLGDPSTPPISEADRKYRDLVIQLGLNLKSNQSLRSLIQSIMSSDIYRRSGMR